HTPKAMTGATGHRVNIRRWRTAMTARTPSRGEERQNAACVISFHWPFHWPLYSRSALIFEERLGPGVFGIDFDEAVPQRIVVRGFGLFIRLSNAHVRVPTGADSHDLARAGEGFQVRPLLTHECLMGVLQFQVEISPLRG